MESKIADMAGVLLAGGRSRRMGRDKRFIELGGMTLFERTLRVFESVFDEILIVVAQPGESLGNPAHRVVSDRVPNCGSLGGLYTGLHYAGRPRVFAAACDMPFLDPAVIRLMSDLDREADIVMPRLATGLQPMHAVYSKTCLAHLEAMIERRQLEIHTLTGHAALRIRFVEEEQVRPVDRRLLSFVNINRPEDLAFAEQLHANRQMIPGSAS